MKNSTILFGLVILIALLSFITKENLNKTKKEISFEKQFNTTSSSIQAVEQLPIVGFKRD